MMKADHEAAMKFARLGAELFRVHHDPKSLNTLKPDVMHEANLSKAYLELAEQLAAEQEKVKALQPYKDAYDYGQDMAAAVHRRHGHIESPDDIHQNVEFTEMYIDDPQGNMRGRYDAIPVRVCKLVEGDG